MRSAFSLSLVTTDKDRVACMHRKALRTSTGEWDAKYAQFLLLLVRHQCSVYYEIGFSISNILCAN